MSRINDTDDAAAVRVDPAAARAAVHAAADPGTSGRSVPACAATGSDATDVPVPTVRAAEIAVGELSEGSGAPDGTLEAVVAAVAARPLFAGRQRRWARTSLRLLRASTADPTATFDETGRRRLLKFHRARLKLRPRQFDELIDRGVVRLLSSDDGDGVVLEDVVNRVDIYRHAASRLSADATLDAVLLVRRVHHLLGVARDERPPAAVIEAAESYMPDDPSFHDYTRLLCGGPMAQTLVAERKARLGGSHRYVRRIADVQSGLLLERAPADLRAWLEGRGFGRVRPVPASCAAQILACRSELLYGLGLIRLDLLLRKPYSRAVYHDLLHLKQIATCADGDDLSTVDGVDRFAREYCVERTRYPNDPETRRNNVGHFLLESHVEVDREIRSAEPADAAMLARYLLPLPRMPREFADFIAKARRRQLLEGRQARKDRVEPIAESLPELRFLAGSRAAELKHDRDCCAAAMAEAGKLEVAAPLELSFSYLAPIYDVDGRRMPGLQRRCWRLLNTNRINEKLHEAGDAAMAHSLPGGRDHREEYDREWWLFYERSEGVDGSEPRDPWLRAAVESLVLYTGRGLPPEVVREQMRFAGANGLAANLASRLPAGFAWFGGSQAKRARRVVVDLAMRPWPMTELCHGMMVAHAGTCVMTTSGARTHEFFQIAQHPSRLYRLDLGGGEVRYVFLAIPKGLDDAVPFVITRDDVKAVWAAAAFASDRWHGGGPIPETPPPNGLGGKCGLGRYVANAGDRPLPANAFTPMVQLLFVGRHELEGYDLRHGMASYAQGAGIPIEIIAAWLNQKSIDVTRYYAKAPKASRDRWWLQFHTAVDLREFQAAVPLLGDAEKTAAVEQVGALASVPGGSCTSLGECPVRFACIGCRRNAADPEKRGEVEASLGAAVSLHELWTRHGRVKAIEEQERTIERHRAMLREMDVIERYRAMRAEVVEPDLHLGAAPPVGDAS